MSILNTLFQAGVALKQLGSGTAFRPPEANVELSDDVRATIDREILPLLEPLEQFRLEKLASKTRRKTWFRRLGWLLWLPSLALDLFMLMSGEPTLYTLFVVGGLGAWILAPELQYTRHYKEKLIPVLLKVFGDYTYEKNGCIDLEAVKSFSILPKFSSKSSEDYISGDVEGIYFEFCELKLKRRGRKSNRTVHAGGALLIAMPFQFCGYTVVGADYGKVGNRLASPLAISRVALESPEFEDRFEVYGSDQQYARYILSPGLMERIIGLDDLFRARAKGAGITCEFRDNKVLFLLSYYGDLLNVADIDVSAYDLAKMPLLEQELAMITGIIRQLKLDSLAERNVASSRFGRTMEH